MSSIRKEKSAIFREKDTHTNTKLATIAFTLLNLKLLQKISFFRLCFSLSQVKQPNFESAVIKQISKSIQTTTKEEKVEKLPLK